MKRIIAILCIIAMMVTFNACDSGKKNESDPTASAVIADVKDSSNSEGGSHIVEEEDSSNPDEAELVVEDEVEVVLEEGQEVTGF